MIQLIATALTDSINALQFVDGFGGAAFPFELKKGGEQLEVEVVPLAYQTSAKGDYSKLVPDSSKKSVCWIEQSNNAPVRILDSGLVVVSFSARFVCWLNRKKASTATGNGQLGETTALLRVFNMRKRELSIEGFGTPVTVTLSPTEIVAQNPRAIFGAYTFVNKAHLFLHPYSYFALSFNCSIEMSVECFDWVALQNPNC